MGRLIGTHNSATGEAGKGFLSWLVTPFARCQSKTIEQQYFAGCRYFDLRIRYDDHYKAVFAHGLWESKKSVRMVLTWLDSVSTIEDPVYCTIMYEGKLDEKLDGWWLSVCENIRKTYPHLHILNVQVKYKWRMLEDYEYKKATQVFKVLDGRSWHTFIPIPWLWSKIYKQKMVEDGYSIVDFL